jgi:hypothetical protein
MACCMFYAGGRLLVKLADLEGFEGFNICWR